MLMTWELGRCLASPWVMQRLNGVKECVYLQDHLATCPLVATPSRALHTVFGSLAIDLVS